MNNKNRRLWVWWLAPAALALLAACLLFGAAGFGFPDTADPGGRLILQLRLQRVAAGFLVGAALSCAGVVFQALLRNPLAEPYVLGVSGGAAMGAALAILAGLNALSVFFLPGAAFIGALLTLGLVVRLARDPGGGAHSVYSLILSGVIVSAIASSMLMFCISVSSDTAMHNILWWMLGNLEAKSPALLLAAAVPVVIGFAGAWLLAGDLNALTLGSDMAHCLGVRARFCLALGLILATAMTAAAVSLAGLIGFVGLVVPHAARSLVGADHRRLLPVAAIGGGLLLAVCDAAARSLMETEIPVGVITAFVGGPFFLILLRSRSRRRAGWNV